VGVLSVKCGSSMGGRVGSASVSSRVRSEESIS
jgi:hypothetical protein